MNALVEAARVSRMQEPHEKPMANHLDPESLGWSLRREGDVAHFPCLSACLTLQCPRGLGDSCAFEVEVPQRATESVESVAS
jgi:hypothetical protein